VAAAYQNAAVAYLARGGANQGKTHAGKDLGGAMADYQAAVELLERAVASAPQNAEAWNCLGKAYYSARKYYDAESCFEHAVQLNGDKTEYRVNLQAVGERLGSAPRDPR
jgi:cytochrome c-type biogenesis protein CcmH/NrfG